MIRQPLATEISKISPLETPKQPLTRSKDLSVCVHDTFERFFQTNKYKESNSLLLTLTGGQSGKRKGAQGFTFPVQEPRKWPASSMCAPIAAGLKMLKIKSRISTCSWLAYKACWTPSLVRCLLLKGTDWEGTGILKSGMRTHEKPLL